jgi:hypothetical protein
LYYLSRTGLYKINIREIRHERVTSRINDYGTAEYDETTRAIVFADEINIFLAGLSKVNILEK